MYNGIGLDTVRGSGTNGYVQRNLSHVRRVKDKIDYKSEEQLSKLEATLNRTPNAEILQHDQKRKIELKCFEMREAMEEQGYTESDIESKIARYRESLEEERTATAAASAVEYDEHGRPIVRETHQIAAAQKEKNARLREAFGLKDYEEGTAFDPERKKRAEEMAKAKKMQQLKQLVDSESETEEVPKKKKKKDKAKHRDRSSSPEEIRRGHKKKKKKSSKKHKKGR